MLNWNKKTVTLVKQIMWNEEMDGNELFDAVLKDEAGEVRVMRCCECFDEEGFVEHEWADCISLEEYVTEYIDTWA
jgi:hypothetical protein